MKSPIILALFLLPFSTPMLVHASPIGTTYEGPKWQGKVDKKKRRVGQWVYATKNVRLIVANYKAGELHGLYESFYANGKKRQRSSYVTNLLNGKFEIFYNNKLNTPAVRGYYLKGQKNRQWARWTPHTRLISQAGYNKGLIDGDYTSFVDGKMYQLFKYRKGKLHGLAKTYSPAHNQVIAQGRYVKNLRQGTWKFWGSDGSKLTRIAKYTNGRLQGIVIQYNENGRVWKNLSYQNGTLHGPYKVFFDLKSRIISDRGHYINGEREGVWTSYYRSSKIWKRSPYKKGQLHGSYVQYYRNGRVWKTLTYSTSKLQGKYTLYSDRSIDAQLLSGQYHNNFRTGKWRYWYPDGKTVNKIVFYKKGAINGVTTRFYPSGRQWVKSQYKQNELDGFHIEYYDNERNSKKLRGAHKNNIPDGKWTYWNTQGKVVIRRKHKHAKK